MKKGWMETIDRDNVRKSLNEIADLGEGFRVGAIDLWERYHELRTGINRNTFYRLVQEVGYARKRDPRARGGRVFVGLRLRRN